MASSNDIRLRLRLLAAVLLGIGAGVMMDVALLVAVLAGFQVV